VNFPPEITHKYVHIEDSEDQEIRSTFEECIVFIRDNLKHGSVLVHCAAGKIVFHE
jgi:protein-tyrosine phosphatase